MSAAKPDEHKKEEKGGDHGAGHEKGHASPSLVSRTLEGGWNASKKVVGGLTRYFGQLVRGTLSGAWKMTGGAIGRGIAAPFRHIAKSVRDVGEIGRQIMAEAQERHHIGKLSPALKGIMLATAMSVGNALYLPFSPAVGAATSGIEGVENVGSALVMKYDAHKGSGSGHAEASHAPEPKQNGNHKEHHA